MVGPSPNPRPRLNSGTHLGTAQELLEALHQITPEQAYKNLERLLLDGELAESSPRRTFLAKLSKKISAPEDAPQPNPLCLQMAECCQILFSAMIRSREPDSAFDVRALEVIQAVFLPANEQLGADNPPLCLKIRNLTFDFLKVRLEHYGEEIDAEIVRGCLTLLVDCADYDANTPESEERVLLHPAILPDLTRFIAGIYSRAAARVDEAEWLLVAALCNQFASELEPVQIIPAVKTFVDALREVFSEKELLFAEDAPRHISREALLAYIGALETLVAAPPRSEYRFFWNDLWLKGGYGCIYGLFGLFRLEPEKTLHDFFAAYKKDPAAYSSLLPYITEYFLRDEHRALFVAQVKKLPVNLRRNFVEAYSKLRLEDETLDTGAFEFSDALQRDLGVAYPAGGKLRT